MLPLAGFKPSDYLPNIKGHFFALGLLESSGREFC